MIYKVVKMDLRAPPDIIKTRTMKVMTTTVAIVTVGNKVVVGLG